MKTHPLKRLLSRWQDYKIILAHEPYEQVLAREPNSQKALYIKRKYSNMRKFHYRFELAINFERIVVKGYEKRTLEGYSAAIKLMMAYNAVEVLSEAIGVKIEKWDIDDEIVANEYRNWLRQSFIEVDDRVIEERLKTLHIEAWLIRDFIKVINHDSNNILPLASICRHLMAHGKLTSTFMDSNASDFASIQNYITDSLLQKAEQKFGDYIDKELCRLKLPKQNI